MNNFSHLNDKQIEAVRTVDGPLLLLAGAGSGKTTVLINRIANLIQNENIAPYEIIAITFTNKAAGEMKARLERMSIANIDDVWASTFHSACAKILRRDIDKLGYDRSFTIYDTADTASLMKRILKEMDIDEKQFPHKMVLSYISRAKDDMMSAASFLAVAEKSRDPRLRIIGQIYMEYEKRLVNSNSLDFDDLILLTVRLFKEHPDVLVRYQKRFKHVLVDEYQDTNNLQYHLTAALAGGHGNICVVGDDDQSIYKFRGATIENILSFEKHFKNAKVIRLEQNYRSTSYILNAANDVIKNNTGRKGKNLWTENAVGDIPSLYIVDDERAEAQFVADTILESVTSGQNYQDHVILYRMNAQSNQFETAFKRNGIPYRVFGGTGFYERAEVKDMLAYLCVIHNPHDDVRLLRIINNPARGLGDTTISRVAAVAAELGTSIFNAIDECFKYENVKSAVGKLTKFVSMINELREIAATSPLDVLYDELLRKTGYIRMLEEKNFEENQSRIENVKELKTNIIAFMNESDGSLFDFLSETALYTDLDRDDQSSDRVFMMTMHSAKGLEFDTVFIVGAEDGIFPSARVIGDYDELEEERRLCYVAMTRAIRKLNFTSAKRRMLFGKTSTSKPSRFIREINPKNIETHDKTTNNYNDYGDFNYNRRESHSTSFYDAYSNQYSDNVSNKTKPHHSASPNRNYSNALKPQSTAKAEKLPQFYSGDKIEHTAFGAGIVKSITPAGSDALLEIDFGKNGVKRLMLKSAQRYVKKA